MTKVIVISGKAGSGKDTFAGLLAGQMENRNRAVLITHYADLLKFICTNYFGWNGVKDQEGRSLLQYVGTNKIRRRYPNYWVDFIIDMLDIFDADWDFVLIPDCRFPNEISKFRQAGYDVRHIHVNRPGYENPLTESQRAHPSENALEGIKPDYTVNNEGDLEDLAAAAQSIMFRIMKEEERL